MKKRYIVLENNTVFEGVAFGADRTGVGELVFATGMCGYIETLTDPSYYGQIVMQTFPLIGNYGIIESDFEGKCCVRGYIVREWCEIPSNYRAQYDLDSFLKKKIAIFPANDYNGPVAMIHRIMTEHRLHSAAFSAGLPGERRGGLLREKLLIRRKD